MQPAILLHFVLQLAWCPAGVAECENGARGAFVAGDGFENIECRGETDALVDRKRGVLNKEISGVQHEPALSLDRAALEYFDGAGPSWQLDTLGRRDHVELDQQVGKVDVRRGLIDHDTHGPFGGMGAHINQRAGEAFIAHAGHGDQHLAIEEAAPALWGFGCKFHR